MIEGLIADPLRQEAQEQARDDISEGDVIKGQMAKIRKAIEEELAAGAPIADLKPGQVWKRSTDRMRNVWRCAPGEIPHRSTFDRFRRLHGLLPPWRAKRDSK
jgi:hypothetical protein